jgi:hypothetical protein
VAAPIVPNSMPGFQRLPASPAAIAHGVSKFASLCLHEAPIVNQDREIEETTAAGKIIKIQSIICPVTRIAALKFLHTHSSGTYCTTISIVSANTSCLRQCLQQLNGSRGLYPPLGATRASRRVRIDSKYCTMV